MTLLAIHPHWIRIGYSGQFSLDTFLATIKKGLLASLQARKKACLLQISQLKIGDFPISDRYQMGKSIADLQLNLGASVLLAVVGNEPYLDPDRFGEMVALNRGARGKTFIDRIEAERWLSQQLGLSEVLPDWALEIQPNGWHGQIGDIQLGCVQTWPELPDLPQFAVKQVHGRKVVQVAGAPDVPLQEADGLWTDQKDQVLVIKTADCLPVHLWNGQKIAMVHAGWRGAKAGILQRALKSFEDAKSVHAVIGPAIQACHYEVDSDLYQAWLLEDPSLNDYLKPAQGSKRMLDLPGYARHFLIGLGIPVENVQLIPVCTHCEAQMQSYRRDGAAADRQKNFIVRRSKI
ncbi:MAG: polyphenol oxidase family protein [Acidobacteria bacterium]|nr:polyphenol oxidase family protein [Acidobacteriota bacterium]